MTLGLCYPFLFIIRFYLNRFGKSFIITCFSGLYSYYGFPTAIQSLASETQGVTTVTGCTHRAMKALQLDALKGFVDLWVHSSFAIFAIFDLKIQLKLLEMAFDQVQTCSIFPFRWAGFPIKFGQNAQWEHLFSTYFDDFLPISLIF